VKIEIPDSYPKIKFKFIQKNFEVNLKKTNHFEWVTEIIKLNIQDLNLNFFMKKVGSTLISSLYTFNVNYLKKQGDQIQSD